MSDETEEIKTFSSTLTCYKDSRSSPTGSQYQLDAPVTKILNTFATPNHPKLAEYYNPDDDNSGPVVQS